MRLFPVKTSLVILSFGVLLALPDVVPGLQNYKILDWSSLAGVLDFGSRRASATPLADEQAKLRPSNRPSAPTVLIDKSHNLDHFYAALHRTEMKKDGAVTRISHYGDSPTTADLITADTRALLQQQFGDAGHGFCLIAKPWAWYGHRGVDPNGSNWKIDIAMTAEVRDGLYGFGGVSFRGGESASTRITVKDSGYKTVEVAYLAQPGGGSFSVEADGEALGIVDTDGPEKKAAFASFEVKNDTEKFGIRVKGGTVRLFGVQFDKPGPGVIYDSLGVNGAYTSILARMIQGDHWTAELRHYNPDLVIVNYGTNESVYPKFINDSYVKEIKEVVRRIRVALPNSSVLIMSPMDRGQRDSSGQISTVEVMPKLVALQQHVAAETGCGFFNTFQAMGGPGTMARWYEAEPRLVGADFIHPMPAGAKIVGGLLYKSLMDGYNLYKQRLLQKQMAADEAKGPGRKLAATNHIEKEREQP